MKIRIVYFITLLLLCMSCAVEEQLRYEGFSGNAECWSVRVGMPDDWKIINAHLETNQVLVEFDRGRGAEKQIVQLSFPIKDLNKHIQFRGANRINDLAILHFTVEEDPQSRFNPPMAKSEIINGFRTKKVYAIFRTSKFLMIYFTIENTNPGKLLSFIDLRSMKNSTDSFKLVNGVLHFKFGGKRHKVKLPTNEFIGPHEELRGWSGSSNFNGNILRWSTAIEIVSTEKKD